MTFVIVYKKVDYFCPVGANTAVFVSGPDSSSLDCLFYLEKSLTPAEVTWFV